MPPVLNSQFTNGIARPYSIEYQDQRRDDPWDEFVESLPDGHHEQTSLWGQVRAQNGWEVHRTVIREHGQIVAGTQMQTRSLGRFGKLAYVNYGPCLGTQDPILENSMIKELKQHARLMGCHFMVVGLPYEGHYLAPGFVAAGFQRKPARFPPHFLEATAVINLSLESEQIFSAMRSSTRRNIRHAFKKGISVAEQTGEGLEEFHRLMVALCKRRNTTPNPARVEFFIELWRRFQPKGWIRLFFAMNGPEPVSAALAFTFGDWFRVWKIGWSGRHRNLKPNEALDWHMISWARQNGFRFYDFVGIDPDEAKRMAGDDRDGNRAETVTSFKLGFGGESKLLPGAYYYAFNPAWRTLFRCCLGRWLDSPLFLKAANPFLGRLYRG